MLRNDNRPTDASALSAAPGFWLVAYAFVVTMAGTTLPTPLYPIYEERLGISELTVTVIFAVYAIGVIAGLLLFGGLSDTLGRRTVLLPGLALSGASAVVFLASSGLDTILAARVLSGLSAGIFTGTATAAMVDFAPAGRRTYATGMAVAANLGGLGLGVLLSGLLAQYARSPLRLPFAVDAALVTGAVVAVLVTPETVTRSGGVPLRLQRLGVPTEVRSVFAIAATAGVAAFAVSGVFSAVGPGLLATVIGQPSHAVAGAIVAVLFIASALGQLGMGRLPSGSTLPAGCLLLIAGVALLAGSIWEGSLALLVASAILAGLGQGLVVGAGLASINRLVRPERRGEAASSFFVLLYLGLIVPVVGVGVVSEWIGLRDAGLAFCALAAATVAMALVSTVVAGRRSRSTERA